jgi:hypothetical protein
LNLSAFGQKLFLCPFKTGDAVPNLELARNILINNRRIKTTIYFIFRLSALLKGAFSLQDQGILAPGATGSPLCSLLRSDRHLAP